jgi:hypothetical protein
MVFILLTPNAGSTSTDFPGLFLKAPLVLSTHSLVAPAVLSADCEVLLQQLGDPFVANSKSQHPQSVVCYELFQSEIEVVLGAHHFSLCVVASIVELLFLFD